MKNEIFQIRTGNLLIQHVNGYIIYILVLSAMSSISQALVTATTTGADHLVTSDDPLHVSNPSIRSSLIGQLRFS